MTHRKFTDSRRVRWDVWDVYPALGDRRSTPLDRRRFIRETEDRRAAFNPMRLSPELAQGWLTFQCRSEKRRLAPVPDGWEALDDGALEQLCAAATPAGRRRRILD